MMGCERLTVPRSADVVVVGGGIVGAAAAAASARRGARVVLFDKEAGPAREASGRAQGSLRVQGRHVAEFPLAEESLRLWLHEAEHGDFELVRGGNLYLQTKEEERALLERLVREAHRAGLTEVKLLEPAAVRDIVPAATGTFKGAMWSPADAQCQPSSGTEHFVRRAVLAGASVRFDTRVTALREAKGQIIGVDTTDGRIDAARVVVAAGVWTPYLTRPLGVKVPIMPVVMSELETSPVPPLFEATLRAFGFGARQRPNGRVVVSAGLNATVRHAVSLADFNGLRYWAPRALAFRDNIRLGVDIRRIGKQIRHRATLSPELIPLRSPEPRPDGPLVDSALRKLSAVIPALANTPVERRWAGLVDMTPDGLPIIDGRVGPDGLVVITGLCGHGFTLGPVLGEIAADLVVDGTTGRPIKAFALSRFTAGKVGKPEMMI